MLLLFLFFFNDTATTEIYTLSLHDALPIYASPEGGLALHLERQERAVRGEPRVLLEVRSASVVAVAHLQDRKSTRLNSSHSQISYAVFCLKKKRLLEAEELSFDRRLDRSYS